MKILGRVIMLAVVFLSTYSVSVWAQSGACVSRTYTAQGKATGMLLNRASPSSIKRVAVARMIRAMRAKVSAKHGPAYRFLSGYICRCKATSYKPNTSTTVTCTLTATPCRSGQGRIKCPVVK